MADLASSPYFLLILFIAAFALPLLYLIWIRNSPRYGREPWPTADAIEYRRLGLWCRSGPGVFGDRESGLRTRGPARPGRRAFRLARRGRGSVVLLDIPPCKLDRGDGIRAGQVLALRPPMGCLPFLHRCGRDACGVQSLLDLGRRPGHRQ